jgi:hypothetical protein
MRRLLLTIAAVFWAIAIDGFLTNLTAALAAPTVPAFFVNNVRCNEGVGTCVVSISVTGGNGRGSWIQAATSNGTATAPADYAARNVPIYVSPGRATSLSVPIVNDRLIEGDEYFFVTIRPLQNAIIGRARAVVTIVDNDMPPPPPPPVVCPDGTTVPAGQTCPLPPPPPPPPQWVSAPLQDGGYARCKIAGGCHSIAYPCFAGTTPPNCSYPNIIAQQGDVLMYAWNGCDAANPCRAIGAFWPIGQYKTTTPYIGVEGWPDEWEGVAPATGSAGQ